MTISKYQLRDYQRNASNAAVNALNGSSKENGLLILPTGGGKSLVIADIASRIDEPLLVLSPSKEITEQNFEKMLSYGVTDCGIYSASVGYKDIRRITFGMIGSVMNHMEEFSHFHKVLVDEAHLCNPRGGMYKEFFESADRQVVGLTATPYRLSSTSFGNQLKFLTRTRPRIFSKVLYYCQIKDLLSKGFLARLSYYDITSLDMSRVRENTKGTEYSDSSLQEEFERSGFYGNLINTTERLLHPKSGISRRGILVFTRFVKEAEMLAQKIPNTAVVSADTPKKIREQILADFKSGRIRVVANAQTLTTGFDYPELDTVVLARPTKSLSLYYQMVGRAIRPSAGKNGWLVDMCGNIKRFGKVDDLMIEEPRKNLWAVTSNGRTLTNTIF